MFILSLLLSEIRFLIYALDAASSEMTVRPVDMCLGLGTAIVYLKLSLDWTFGLYPISDESEGSSGMTESGTSISIPAEYFSSDS